MTDAEERAQQLAAEHPESAELLRFAAGLLRAQASVRADRLTVVAVAARPVLQYCARQGPPELSADAREALRGGFDARVLRYWETGELDYLARAALAPFARAMRERGESLERGVHGACVYCGGGAWIASRRIPPGPGTGEGALRMLHCALCGLGWQIPRIKCPGCGEEDPEKLPNFSAPQHPIARIEACDTCKGYVKSIDLTQDMRPVPEIDELLSVSMDLWAVEQGYERLEPGIAGI